jgi:hypothetical protein
MPGFAILAKKLTVAIALTLDGFNDDLAKSGEKTANDGRYGRVIDDRL